MATNLYGNISLQNTAASLGDGDEIDFSVSGSLSVSITLSVDSGGNIVSGSGTLSGSFAGAAVSEQNCDGDGFTESAKNFQALIVKNPQGPIKKLTRASIQSEVTTVLAITQFTRAVIGRFRLFQLFSVCTFVPG